MMSKFHLGWFMNFTPPDWQSDLASPDVAKWADGRFYVDMARNLERACFDYIMIEDTVMVADAYGGTMEGSLKNAVFAPKQDPVPLAVLLAASTAKLGVVATMSTSFYPPYLLARVCSTVDSIAQGRFGWNIVSSAEDRAAQNFGMDRLAEHDDRYAIADEYFDVVNRLWDSWEPDAVVMDRATHTYADYTKVHTIDFDGKYFKSRGPLNTVGTAEQVARKMGEAMEAVGGDGFLISRQRRDLSRQYISEITDRLVPALQRQGLAHRIHQEHAARDAARILTWRVLTASPGCHGTRPIHRAV
jgi:long-chain alkane monooxygenase